MKTIISPSILTVAKKDIITDISAIEQCGAEWIHFDIMDGKFVPAKTFDLDETKTLLQKTEVVKDVHIMIENPKEMAKAYIDAGADYLTFHYEACKNDEEVNEVIDLIHSNGCKAGLSIKPKTSVEAILPFINKLDLVLIMSVEPGKGGQKFIENSLEKINLLKNYISDNKINDILIEVDGGINDKTFNSCVEAGADVLVVGSYLFDHPDFVERFKKING